VSRDGQRLAGFAVLIGAVLLALGVLGDRMLGVVTGPEVEIITLLKKAERGVDLSVPGGGTLVGAALQYQRLSVTVDPVGQTAVATGTLDFTGVFNRDTRVSSLGLERVPFRYREGSWVAEAGFAPRLVAVVAALEQRRRRLQTGDFGEGSDAGAGDPAERDRLLLLTRRTYRSNAWFIRSERHEIEVAEDYRLTGEGLDRPTDEKATKRLTLTEDASGHFFFPNGLL